MNRTNILFQERKAEIDFYYGILLDITNNKIRTSDNNLLERILKSNFLLMLYNLIEACVISGFIEVYELVNAHTYEDIIPEIQKKWYEHKIDTQSSESTSNQGTYKRIVATILNDVLAKKVLDFKTNEHSQFAKTVLRTTGNLDARKIRSLLKEHSIDFDDLSEKPKIKIVMNKRNCLAHGEDSFGDSVKDYSVPDLKFFKDEVLTFMQEVLGKMSEYSDGKKYIKKL